MDKFTIKPRLHETTCCQTGCQTALTTGCIVYTNIQPAVKPVWQPVWQPAVSCIQGVVKPVVQPGLTTGWTISGCSFNPVERTVAVRSIRLSNTTGMTTGWMFVYTIQPVIKPVVQPVWQPVVSCKRGIKHMRLKCMASESQQSSITSRRVLHRESKMLSHFMISLFVQGQKVRKINKRATEQRKSYNYSNSSKSNKLLT